MNAKILERSKHVTMPANYCATIRNIRTAKAKQNYARFLVRAIIDAQ